jgi:hypothetical protein
MRVFAGALVVFLFLGTGLALADEEPTDPKSAVDVPSTEAVEEDVRVKPPRKPRSEAGEEEADDAVMVPDVDDADWEPKEDETVGEELVPPEDVSREEFEALRERVAELEAEEGKVKVFSAAAQKVTIFGQIRSRFEYQKNFDFDRHTSDTRDFFVLRTRLGVDVEVVEHLDVRVKLQDSRRFGDEGGVTTDTTGVDLKEGYLDLERALGGPVDFRVGRAEMKFGDQRLISPLDWHPVGRSWDGMWLTFEEGPFSSDLFFTRIDDDFLGMTRSEREDFFGLYNTFSFPDAEIDLEAEADLYVLFRRNHDEAVVVAEDGNPGHEQLWTIGSRISAEADFLSLVGEFAVQLGDYASDDVMAHMAELGIDVALPADYSPHVDVTVIWASGDSDPSDGNRNTFDPLYTFGHYYLGLMDRVGRRNVISPRVRLSAKPCDGWTIFLDGHAFWLETSEDALYDARGVAIRGPIGGSDRYVGSEVDLHAKGKILKRLAVWVGYSRFFTGRGTRDTGGGDDADYFFLQLTLGF